MFKFWNMTSSSYAIHVLGSVNCFAKGKQNWLCFRIPFTAKFSRNVRGQEEERQSTTHLNLEVLAKKRILLGSNICSNLLSIAPPSLNHLFLLFPERAPVLCLLVFFPDLFCPCMDSAPCTETDIKKQHLYAAIWEAWRLEVMAVASSSSHIWPLRSIGFRIVYVEVGKHNVWFPDLEKGRHRKLRRTVSCVRGRIQDLWLLFLCRNYSVLSQVGGQCGDFSEHFPSSVTKLWYAMSTKI